MKIIVDNETKDYIELKKNRTGEIELSIRAKKDLKSTIMMTVKLNPEIHDKLISNLILLKSREKE